MNIEDLLRDFRAEVETIVTEGADLSDTDFEIAVGDAVLKHLAAKGAAKRAARDARIAEARTIVANDVRRSYPDFTDEQAIAYAINTVNEIDGYDAVANAYRVVLGRK